ncbi:Tim44-domain-containing protein [Myriangium duriaei CBS 260.36]|uniref:Mitochondrial import inner membrane translocase subunit TIM44 n=1 Tax=Myriangium duriaei CBS 260.36 TaxID=1168546 RepID=A0A9P4MKZ3_9PEZI|nr:Tim44-domain-containing protein [Myriangium duriaei CBS 260.36]
MSALLKSSIVRNSTAGLYRAGGASTGAAQNSQYGRTAAYRRIANLRSIHTTTRDATILPSHSSPRPVSLAKLVPSLSYNTVRSISFRELKKAHQEEKEGTAAPRQQQRKSEASASPPKSEPEVEPAKEESSKSAADEAEEAYAKARAESEKEEAKFNAKQEQEQEGEGASDKKKDAPEAPKHGSKTPWQVFTETLSTEFKASKEWNDSTKQLSGTMHDFTQNPNVQKARSAYTKASDAAGTASSAALKSTAGAIGKGAAWTWDTGVVKGIRKGANAVGSGLEKATRPVRETEAYKNVRDVIDDGSSSRYGGWVEKEERRKKREAQELKDIASGKRRAVPLEEDPEAGTNITLHKDAAWKESWRDFRDSSKMMQRLFAMKSTYAESENPLISTARSISDRVAGFFAENETATVIKKFREMDPSFQLEPFLQEMREYILPEVLDAYVKGDVETLKLWLSAAQYQVYAALMHQYTQHGLKSDGRILDIRNVDILNARMLDPGEIPVFVIMCRTQEVHVYRNKKTGQLASGMEDKVQQVTYAIGITRVPEDVNNPETRGWRLIELQKSGRDYI